MTSEATRLSEDAQSTDSGPQGPVLPPEWSADTVATLGKYVSDYICAHRPVLDDEGRVIDGHVVWWNDAYNQIRNKPVEYGQSLMETYFEPEVAMEYFREAFETGHVKQIFEYTGVSDQYRPPVELVKIRIDWIRLGPVVVEIGADISKVTMLELDLKAQELAIREAAQLRLRLADRERIARDLHDSVIQQLFATVLYLQLADGQDLEQQRATMRQTVAAIDLVISDIRNTIFEINREHTGTLEERLRDVVDSFSVSYQTVFMPAIGEGLVPDPVLADDIERVVLEALANVARHAKATSCSVDVTIDANRATVIVSDDGIGMPREATRSSGLSNLRERAVRRRGTFVTERDPSGSGTRLTWSVPFSS